MDHLFKAWHTSDILDFFHISFAIVIFFTTFTTICALLIYDMSRFSVIFADLLDSLNQVSIQYETCNSIQVSVSSHSIHIHIYYLCFWDDTKKYCCEYEYLYVWVFITYMYCTNVLYFHMGRIPTIQPIDDVWLHKGALEQLLFFNVQWYQYRKLFFNIKLEEEMDTFR